MSPHQMNGRQVRPAAHQAALAVGGAGDEDHHATSVSQNPPR